MPYGVFGVTSETATIMMVERSVAITAAFIPRDNGRMPLSIRRNSAIPLMIPATAPYSFAGFQNRPNSNTWKNATVIPPLA